jgi:hypothetical protein
MDFLMFDCEYNYFDMLFLTLKEDNLNDCPYKLVIEAYLYRKSAQKSKSKPLLTRDESFWNSKFVFEVPSEIYNSEDFILALARYFAQETAENTNLMTKVLIESPITIRTAIRRSQMVLNKEHKKWNEIELLAKLNPHALSDLILTCKAFQSANDDRLNLIKKFSEPFKGLTLFEFLSLSAVYSFKHLKNPAASFDGGVISADAQLRALTELVQWKLKHSSKEDFVLNEAIISRSLKCVLVKPNWTLLVENFQTLPVTDHH